MRAISGLFSLQHFVVLLASISALATAYAAPVRSDYMTLDRRATTVTVSGKVAELGEQVSPASHAKSTVYRLSKWDGKANPGYVIKIYKSANLDDKEVRGLTAAGQYIASDAHVKAVVMKEVTGPTLAHMVAAVHKDKRQEFVHHWQPIVAAAAAAIASSKGILHTDLNMNNVVVNGDHVQLIDWEHFAEKGSKEFTTDASKIENTLRMVWDSEGTPQVRRREVFYD